MTEELKNLYALARRAKNDGNDENAAKYYEMILMQNPNDWEANFYSTYYQVRCCKIGEIESAAIKLSNSERTIFKLIKNGADPSDYNSILNEVCANLIDIASLLYRSYHNHYNDIGDSIKANYMGKYLSIASSTRNILYIAGDLIIEYFGDDYGVIAAACWEGAVMMHNKVQMYAYNWLRNKFNISYSMEQNGNRMKAYNAKISRYNPSYNPEPVYMGLSSEQLRVEGRNKALGTFFAILILLGIAGFIALCAVLGS